MPTIPRYEPAEKVPSARAMPSAPAVRGMPRAVPYTPMLEVQARFGEALARDVGGVLARRAEKISRQNDLNYVLESGVAYSDDLRKIAADELARKGKDTYGNVERVQAWAQKAQQPYLDNAPSDEARSNLVGFFFKNTSPLLDDLAAIQVRERKNVSLYNLEAVKESARKGAYLDPADVARYNGHVTGAVSAMASAGVIDETAARELLDKYGGEVYGAALDGLIDTDPALAIQVFRAGEFDGHLTESQLNTYADRINAAIEAHAKEAERQAAELKKAQDEALKKLRGEVETGFITKFQARQLTVPEIISSPLEASRKEHWVDKINSRIEADKKGKDDPFEITDPKTYGRLSHLVNTSPETIRTPEDIWTWHGKGLKTDDCQKLQELWEKRTKPDKADDPAKTQRARRYHQILKSLWSDGILGDPKAEASAYAYGQKANLLDDFLIRNPGASDREVEQFFKILVGEEERGFFGGLMDRMAGYLVYGPGAPLFEKEETPSPERDDAIRVLIRAGKPITEANIRNIMEQLERR